MAKTRRRYSSRRRARGRKVKHSVKRRVHKKRNNRGKGKSKRRSRGRKHSRRMRGGQNPCQGDSNCCEKEIEGNMVRKETNEQVNTIPLENDPANTYEGWHECQK